MQAVNQIHCICLIKNEIDIIEYSLREASKWADYIYIFDNGSTDGTWEKVLSMENDQIVPWKHDDKPFKEALRGDVFNAFKHRAKPGDWWCRLDADEFYLESPWKILSNISLSDHVVWGIAIEYYLSQRDLDEIDFSQDISKLLNSIRSYKVENSEPRFFKHRAGLTWDEDGSWPNHMGLVSSKRIYYKHYKYRSPQQIQKRLLTRQQAIKRGFPGWEHAIETDWLKKIIDFRELNLDISDGNFVINHSRLPQHLEKPWRRILKYVMHGTKIWP